MGSWRIVGIWMALILVLSISPTGPDNISPIWPNAVHFIEYSVLGMLLLRAVMHTRDITYLGSSVFAVGTASLYGVMMEIVQLFLPHRSFSVADMVVNFIGAAVAVILLRTLGLQKR